MLTADQLSPRLGIVYKMTPDTTLHAGYARYFTPPPTELISQKTVSLYENTSNAPEVSENSPVLPERSHYFDAGVTQKITSALTVGVDGYYKIIRDLIDEGQFGQALIYAPFNYAQGRIEGVETDRQLPCRQFCRICQSCHYRESGQRGRIGTV